MYLKTHEFKNRNSKTESADNEKYNEKWPNRYGDDDIWRPLNEKRKGNHTVESNRVNSTLSIGYDIKGRTNAITPQVTVQKSNKLV